MSVVLKDIYLETIRLLESGESFCKASDCGWACCAMSRAVDNLGLTSIEFHLASQRFRCHLGAWWWGGKKTPENQLGRLTALWALVKEEEAIHA